MPPKVIMCQDSSRSLEKSSDFAQSDTAKESEPEFTPGCGSSVTTYPLHCLGLSLFPLLQFSQLVRIVIIQRHIHPVNVFCSLTNQ